MISEILLSGMSLFSRISTWVRAMSRAIRGRRVVAVEQPDPGLGEQARIVLHRGVQALCSAAALSPPPGRAASPAAPG